MRGVPHITLLKLIMPRLVHLPELRIVKLVLFQVGLSELSIRSSRVYKSTE